MCDKWNANEDNQDDEDDQDKSTKKEQPRHMQGASASFLPKATQALLEVMQPPPAPKIVEGYEDLLEIGALLCADDIVSGGMVSSASEKARHLDNNTVVTPLGFFVSSLPLDLRLGRMVALGALLGVMPSALVIACSIGMEEIYAQPYPLLYLGDQNSNLEARNADLIRTLSKTEETRKILDRGTYSDHLGVLSALDLAVEWKFSSYRLMDRGLHSRRVHRLAQTAREVSRHICDKFPAYAEDLRCLLHILPDRRGATLSLDEGRQGSSYPRSRLPSAMGGGGGREYLFPQTAERADLLRFVVGVGLCDHLLCGRPKEKLFREMVYTRPCWDKTEKGGAGREGAERVVGRGGVLGGAGVMGRRGGEEGELLPFAGDHLGDSVLLSYDGTEDAAPGSANKYVPPPPAMRKQVEINI